jgi:hypothetical protein
MAAPTLTEEQHQAAGLDDDEVGEVISARGRRYRLVPLEWCEESEDDRERRLWAEQSAKWLFERLAKEDPEAKW